MTAGAKLPGKRMELKCAFQHNSSANVSFKWLFMGNKIENCQHYKVEEKVVGNEVLVSLLINPVAPVNMGVYTCLARWRDTVTSTSCSITMRGMFKYIYLIR